DAAACPIEEADRAPAAYRRAVITVFTPGRWARACVGEGGRGGLQPRSRAGPSRGYRLRPGPVGASAACLRPGGRRGRVPPGGECRCCSRALCPPFVSSICDERALPRGPLVSSACVGGGYEVPRR